MTRPVTRAVFATAIVAVVAACGAQPAAPRSPAPGPDARCRSALVAVYKRLGPVGAGRFAAAVNAESFAGGLPAACRGVSRAELLRLARQVAT